MPEVPTYLLNLDIEFFLCKITLLDSKIQMYVMFQM